MKKLNKKILGSVLAVGAIAGVASVPAIVALTETNLNTDSSASLESPGITANPTNLAVLQGSSAGAMDISWDTADTLTANSIIFFAVQDSLFPELGWKIYSSTQTGFITLADDFLSATIVDNSFINQGNTYNVSIGIDVDSAETDTGVEFFGGTVWTNWNESTLGVDATIVVTDSVTGFSTPTNPPVLADGVMLVDATTSQSISFTVTYSNGSLEFNPNFVVTIIDEADVTTVVPAKDLNVTFTTGTTATIEILRLTPATTYDTISVVGTWSQEGITRFTETINATNTANIDETTLGAPSSLIATTSFDDTSGSEEVTVTISGNAIQNTITAGETDIVITNLDNTSETVLLSTIEDGNAFIGTHVIDVSTIISDFTNLSIDIRAVEELDPATNIIPNNVIIEDGINDTGTTTATTYSLNSVSATGSVINDPMSIAVTTGSQTGELDVSWGIDYPQGVTLSQLDFTVEVSTDAGANWVDFTDQTSNFATNMKSATISGLNGAAYAEGVTVQITIGFVGATQTTPISSTTVVSPKQPVYPSSNSGLSTGALIGIIVGSVAGAILIGLGAFFIIKKKNSDDKPSTEKKDEVKKPV